MSPSSFRGAFSVQGPVRPVHGGCPPDDRGGGSFAHHGDEQVDRVQQEAR
jgi:hypothetical protein